MLCFPNLVTVATLCLGNKALVHAFSPPSIGNSISAKISPVRSLNLSFLDNLFSNITPVGTGQQQKQYPKVSVPSDFSIPEPRPLTLTRSTDLIPFITASAGLGLRLATGAFVLGWQLDSLVASELNADGEKQYSLKLGPFRIRDSSSVLDQAVQPEQTLVLYDNDSSPNCKRVREMMNLLDITYEVRPVFEINHEPRLFDPNSDETICDTKQIIEHLLEMYGPPSSTFDRKALWPIEFEAFAVATSKFAASLRGNPGSTRQSNARIDNEKMQSIELWGYECSPFVKPVREKLCNLGLPHRVVSCSRGSKNRDRMIERTGRFQVPFLVDSNTGIEMYEGPEIVEYLEAVYTLHEG